VSPLVLDRAGSPQPATADRDPPSSTLSVAVVQHEQDFAALAPDWEALCSTSNARVYQSFDWQWLWWTHFGSGLALHIVAFRRDGELVGVAPFYVHTDSPCGLGFRRCLRLLGSPVRIRERSGTSMTYDPSDYLDIVVRPGCEDAVGRALAVYLRDHRAAYDVIEVVNTPEDSTVMTVMVPCFRRVGFTVELPDEEARPLLEELIHLAGRALRTDDYDYAHDTMAPDSRKLVARHAAQFLRMRPPAEGVMFIRAFGGLQQNLRLLGARGDFRPFYRSLLPLVA